MIVYYKIVSLLIFSSFPKCNCNLIMSPFSVIHYSSSHSSWCVCASVNKVWVHKENKSALTDASWWIKTEPEVKLWMLRCDQWQTEERLRLIAVCLSTLNRFPRQTGASEPNSCLEMSSLFSGKLNPADRPHPHSTGFKSRGGHRTFTDTETQTCSSVSHWWCHFVVSI